MFFVDLAYAMGTAGGEGAQGGAGSTFIMMAVMIAIFYFLLIRPQQKQRKLHQEFLKNLKRGDQVVTSGGIFGRVTGITETFVTLEVADNVHIKVTKGNVVKPAVPKEGPPAKKGKSE
jgi:preprotein translocase subunit YajC